MNYITKMHKHYGHMPQELIKMRTDLTNALLKQFGYKYGNIDYKLVNDSF
jgi:hypothetical protein